MPNKLHIRFAAYALSGCLLLAGGCGGGISKVLSRVPLVSSANRYLPESDAVPGLVRTGRVRAYRGNEMRKYQGKSAALYLNYRATGLSVADFYLSEPGRSLTIESYSMDGNIAAAGIFHYFRGRKLKGAGRPVPAGAEGVLDVRHEKRNLYFYKQRYFMKIIYTGTKPIPDLVPLAQAICARIPGSGSRPAGFKYLAVKGVNPKTAHVTPGYTFNCDFLPPGITAKAPGAGSVVSDVYLIVHNDDKEAEHTGRDYRQYLQINGKDFTLKRKSWHGRPVWTARDPSQGRVVCTVYKKFVIIVARPRSYPEGEQVVDNIVARIRSR